MSNLGGVVAPTIAVFGSLGVAWLTARTSLRSIRLQIDAQRSDKAAEVDAVETGRREAAEDAAYDRAAGYYAGALENAQRDLKSARERIEQLETDLEDERRERREAVAEERRERREEHDALNRQLGLEREARRRAEKAASALARRVAGEPDAPDKV